MTLQFIGRDAELSQLIKALKKAKSGTPQMAVIQAESGFGKTRLAQEFFAWLAQNDREENKNSYWPEKLSKSGDNLEIYPDPNLCGKGDSDPNFIWWGLRFTDPLHRNASGMNKSGVLSNIHDSLLPHLATLNASLAAQDRKQARAKMIISDAVLNGAGFIPLLGPLLGLSVAVVKNIEREIDASYESGVEHTPESISNSAQTNLSDQVGRLIRAVSFSPPKGLSPRPFVLMIDDAQWSDHDPEFTRFCRRLISEAKAEGWPLLLLLTSWTREWELSDSGGRQGHLSSLKSLFKPEALHLIKLDKVSGLETLVTERFKGLSEEQITLFCDVADGNPLFMEELIRRFETNKGDFIDRDITKPLTPDGQNILQATNLVELVEARFAEASEDVQMTLAIAGLQGIKFSKKMTVLSTQELGKFNPSQMLLEAETPYAFIRNAIEDLGEFRIRHYRQAALNRLRHLCDEAAAHKALDQARNIIANETSSELQSDEDLHILIEQTSFLDSGELSTKLAALLEYTNRLKRKFQFDLAYNFIVEVCSQIDIELLEVSDIPIVTTLLSTLPMRKLKPKVIFDLIVSMNRKMALAYKDSLPDADAHLKGVVRLLHLVGDRSCFVGNTAFGLMTYRQGLTEAQVRLASNETPDAIADIAALHLSMAVAYRDDGKIEHARQEFEACLDYRTKVWTHLPTDYNKVQITIPRLYLAGLDAKDMSLAKAEIDVLNIIDIRRKYFSTTPKQKNRRLLMEALQYLGNIYFSQDKMELAEPHFLESLELAQAAYDQIGTDALADDLFFALRKIGNIRYRRKKNEKALDFYNKALPLLERKHILSPSLKTLNSLASDAEHRAEMSKNGADREGLFRRALKYAGEAYALKSNMGQLSECARCTFKLGNVIWMQGRKKEGSQLMKKAVSDLVQIADETGRENAIKDAAFFANKLFNLAPIRHIKYAAIFQTYSEHFIKRMVNEKGVASEKAEYLLFNSPHGIL